MFFVPYQKCRSSTAFFSGCALFIFTYWFDPIMKTIISLIGMNDIIKFILLGIISMLFVQLYIIFPTNKLEFKLNCVLVSTIHASLTIIAYLSGVSSTVIQYLSVTYYLVDLVLMWVTQKVNIQVLGLTLHHIVCTIVFLAFMKPTLDSTGHVYLYRALFYSELSNLPMYLYQIVNVQIKRFDLDDEYDLQKLVIIICEYIMFFVLRIIGGGIVLYKAYKDHNSHQLIWMSGIIIMSVSVFWTNKLFKQCIREYIRVGYKMKKTDYFVVVCATIASFIAIICL